MTTSVLHLEPEVPSKTAVNGHPPLAILPRRDSEEERTATRVRFNLHPTVVRRDSGAGITSIQCYFITVSPSFWLTPPSPPMQPYLLYGPPCGLLFAVAARRDSGVSVGGGGKESQVSFTTILPRRSSSTRTPSLEEDVNEEDVENLCKDSKWSFPAAATAKTPSVAPSASSGLLRSLT